MALPGPTVTIQPPLFRPSSYVLRQVAFRLDACGMDSGHVSREAGEYRGKLLRVVAWRPSVLKCPPDTGQDRRTADI